MRSTGAIDTKSANWIDAIVHLVDAITDAFAQVRLSAGLRSLKKSMYRVLSRITWLRYSYR
jgi:hypothetical protein